MIIVFLLAVYLIVFIGTVPIVALLIRRRYPESKRIYKTALLYSAFITFIYFVCISIFRLYSFEILRFFYFYLWFISVGFYIALIYRIVEKITQRRFSVIPYLVLIVALCIYWIWNFYRPIPITTLDIVSEKITAPVTFTLLWDIQYWSTTKAYMNRVIKRVNELASDYSILVWDLIDFDLYNREDFEILHTLQAPMFFVTWNHEYYHESSRILSYLSDYEQLIILDDEQYFLDDYNIVLTWLDYRHHNASTFEDTVIRLRPEEDRYAIFLNHIPEKVRFTAEQWFDLLLYWHTHAWQLFPYNLLIRVIYPYGIWKSRIGESIVYTTAWAWLWWPRMRVWTNNEIVVIRLFPE